MGCRIGAGSAVRPNPAKFTAVPWVAEFCARMSRNPLAMGERDRPGRRLFYTLRQSRSPIAVYCVWILRLRHETRGVSAPRIRLGSPEHCDLVTGLAFGLVHVIPIAANSMDCWS